jgi:hypothetical protein
METTYVAFDTRSGQILSVHYGAVDAKEIREGAEYHTQYEANISDEYVEVLTVPPDTLEQGKQYKVDVSRKALVATEGQDGVGFSFGVTGRSP